ncbi:MAG TPA: hypothetical protein VGD65_02895 [Chryseosolibacter sp.]
MTRPLLTFLLATGISAGCHSQVKKLREYERTFQVSLLPGISSNGIASGSYYNKFSLNIFGGLSAGNHHAELGLISNVNLKKTTGIQIAGIGNVVGANAFVNLTLSEERAMIHDDFECNFKGIQLAGLINYVRDNSRGIQLTGGMNVTGFDFHGFQIAGIGNSAGGASHGFHLAGFYNIAEDYIAGIQISTLFNYTSGELSGTQIGLINKSLRMHGKKSMPPTKARSLQIGLINFCKEMEGTQIGLINFGGELRGKQFGLINFFQRLGTKEYSRNGTPVGLINIGSFGSALQLSHNEIFATTIEYTTGNCLNCTYTQSRMPYADLNKIYNQNALIFAYDHWKERWGFGYGFQKMLYNKHSMLPTDPLNERRLINYGIKFIHLNRNRTLDKTFNLVTKLNFEIGRRKGSKYFFVGASLNYFLYETRDGIEEYSFNTIALNTGKVLDLSSQLWPGYTAGIKL